MKKVSAEHVLFKIDASRCALQVGDHVTAEQIIGEDADTGELLQAGCDGQVEAISFSGADHCLLVLVKIEASVVEQTSEADPVCLRIDASWCAVRVGDPVMPETVIGKDAETGETIHAGTHGRVEAVSFSGADHALIVLIQP